MANTPSEPYYFREVEVELQEKPLSKARALLVADWLKREHRIVLAMGWRSLYRKTPEAIAAKLGLDVAEVRRAAGPGVEAEG